MRGMALALGLLLLLGGGAVAVAQFAATDSSWLGRAQEYLISQNALYAGAGAGTLGLILTVAGLFTGNRKKTPASSIKTTGPVQTESTPVPDPAPLSTPAPCGHPVARTAAAEPESSPSTTAGPHAVTLQRISDLVTINGAIKAFHAKTGSYPAALDGLRGAIERGANWIPGLVPDFLPELPLDPAGATDNSGPQYQYVSDGLGYKLIVHGVSADGSNVEVHGVGIDPERRNENGFWAYGFWTEAFAGF